MVKQIQKKTIRIFYRCEVCGEDFLDIDSSREHETQCYELQEEEK